MGGPTTRPLPGATSCDPVWGFGIPCLAAPLARLLVRRPLVGFGWMPELGGGETLLTIYRILCRLGRRRQRLAVVARAERIMEEASVSQDLFALAMPRHAMPSLAWPSRALPCRIGPFGSN